MDRDVFATRSPNIDKRNYTINVTGKIASGDGQTALVKRMFYVAVDAGWSMSS